MARPEILESNFGNYTIQGIEEIVLPPAVSWLPNTIAWKLLGIVVCAAFLIIMFKAAKKWRRNEYRRIALKQIADIRSTMQSNDSDIWLPLSALPVVMKTVALSAFPREDIASLSGQRWLDFLNASSRKRLFSGDTADALTRLAYQSPADTALKRSDAEQLLVLCEKWIRLHRPVTGARLDD